jgi:hypothetical protein
MFLYRVWLRKAKQIFNLIFPILKIFGEIEIVNCYIIHFDGEKNSVKMCRLMNFA